MMNTMRKIDAGSRGRSAGRLMPTLRLGAVVLGIAYVATSGIARAQENDDDLTFEEKIVKQIMTGIGGTNMENSGIDYRERSPLVLPPKVDLPPPASATEVNVPNWPRDVEGERRRAARKTERKLTPAEGGRSLLPSELAARAAPSRPDPSAATQPGNSANNPMLSPSQLGFNGNLLGLFKGNSSESATFTGEPTRESLTQPPAGYQTPSPNFAYGTGPKQSLNAKRWDVQSGKEVGN